MNLSVQLCKRSVNGVVLPIAVSLDTGLVRLVAQHIVGQLENQRYDDELLKEIASRECETLRNLLPAVDGGGDE